MKKWQRYWLFFVFIFSLLHFGRDLLQELQLNSLLTKSLDNTFHSSPRWNIWLGFISEGASAILAFICLRKNKFGSLGQLTFLTMFLFVFAFLTYYLIY